MRFPLRKNIFTPVVIAIAIVSFLFAYFVPLQINGFILIVAVFLALVIIFLFVGAWLSIQWFLVNKREEEKFAQIRQVRDMLRLELPEFRDFWIWYLARNGYKFFVGPARVSSPLLFKTKRDKRSVLVAIFKRIPNEMVTQSDVHQLKERENLSAYDEVMIISTGQFEDGLAMRYHLPGGPKWISGEMLEKNLNRKAVEDPF